jgi:hypothetical protein
MARVKANLMDEDDELITSIEIETDEEFHPNSWFHTPDGGTYVVAEVRRGTPPADVELDGRWLDGTHPTTLVGGHS